MRSFRIFNAQFCSKLLAILLLLLAEVDSKRSSVYWTNDHEISLRVLDSLNSTVTTQPTAQPTAEPTTQPTAQPTTQPTTEPTAQPTAEPTTEPTAQPTAQPTAEPSAQPSALSLTDGVYCEFTALLGLPCNYTDGSAQLCGDSHVFCNDSDAVVGLSYAGLSGVFPSLFTQLVTLEFLSITDSELSGELPTNIGNLASLSSLTIANTGVSGSIPQSLSKLTLLSLLDLSENKLTSTIPSFLGTLPFLSYLDLAGNSFTGAIPSSLCTSNISTLNIGGNSGALCYPPCLLTSNITVNLTGASSCTSSPTTIPTVLPTASPTSQSLCIKLDLYDNFGDGWDTANLLVYSSNGVSKSYGLPCGESHDSTSHCFDVSASENEDFVMVHVVGYKPKYEWDIFWQATNTYDDEVYLGNSQTELIFVFYKSLDSTGNWKYSIKLEVVEELASHPDNCKQYQEKISKSVLKVKGKGDGEGYYNTTVPSINGTVYYNISANSTSIFKNASSNSSSGGGSHNGNKSLLSNLSNDKQSISKGTVASKTSSSSKDSKSVLKGKGDGEGYYNTTVPSINGTVHYNISANASSSNSSSSGGSHDGKKSLLTNLSNDKQSIAKGTSSSSKSDNSKNLIQNKDSKSSTSENTAKGNGKRLLSLPGNSNDNNKPRSLKSELLSSSSSKSGSSKSIAFNRKSSGPVTPSAAYFDLMGTWNSKYSEDFDVNYYISTSDGQKLLYTGTKCSTPFDPSDNYRFQYQDGEYVWRVDGILSDNKDEIEWDFCDYIGGVGTELFFKISKGKCYPVDILAVADICAGDEAYYEFDGSSYNLTETTSEKLVTLEGKIHVVGVTQSTLAAADLQLLSDSLVEEVGQSKLAATVLTHRITLAAYTTTIGGRRLEGDRVPLTEQQQQELIHEAEEEKEDREAMKYAHVLEFSLSLVPSSVLTKEIDNVADIQKYMSHALSSKLFLHKVQSTATRQNLPNLQGVTSISLVDFHVLHHIRENVWLSDAYSAGIVVGGAVGMTFVVLVAAYIWRTNRRPGITSTRRGYRPAYLLSDLDNTLTSIDDGRFDSSTMED